MKKTLLVLFVVIFFFSCSSFMYYPHNANAPFFTEKDELKVSAGLKGYSFYLNSAYALSDHAAVQLNSNYMSLPPATEFGTEYKNGNLYAETAVGLYYPFANKLMLELFLGGGLGQTQSNNLTSDIFTTRDYGKVYLQADFGFHSTYFDAGIVLKEAVVSIYKEKVDGVSTATQRLDSFFEPLVFIAVGGEKFKVNLQAGLSYSQFAAISYAPFIVSLGMETKFSLKK